LYNGVKWGKTNTKNLDDLFERCCYPTKKSSYGFALFGDTPLNYTL